MLLKIIGIIVIIFIVLAIIEAIMEKVEEKKEAKEEAEWEAYIKTPEGQAEMKRIEEEKEKRAEEERKKQEDAKKRREDYIRSIDEDWINCIPLLNHNSDMSIEECRDCVYDAEKLVRLYLENIIAYKNKFKKNEGGMIIKDTLTKIDYDPEKNSIVLIFGDGKIVNNQNQSVYREISVGMAIDERMNFTSESYSNLKLGEELVVVADYYDADHNGFYFTQGVLLVSNGKFFEPTRELVIKLYDKLKA
ncbi:MAG: hypothetical protein K6F66_03125 [Pseudobutyrivibrio sp.]|nr:hypothetical protein [Pseudobutyrivibrio sp.]